MNKICFDAYELKTRFLFGLDLVDKEGNPYPDETIQHEIDTALDEFDNFMGVRLAETKFLTNPISSKKLGYDYDEKMDAMNVYNDETGYGTGLYFFQKRIPITPIISIERFAWKLNQPDQLPVLEFPLEWVKFKTRHGLVQVRPVPGVSIEQSILLLNYGHFYLPLLTHYNKVTPHLLEIDYTCGYCRREESGTVSIADGSDTVNGTDTQFKNLPPVNLKINMDDEDRCYRVKKVISDTQLVLRETHSGALTGVNYRLVDRSMKGVMTAIEIIGRLAAINILNVLGDAYRVGISSESWSADGLSASVSYTAGVENATFGARIIQYGKDLRGRTAGEPGLIDNWRDKEKGFQIGWI